MGGEREQHLPNVATPFHVSRSGRTRKRRAEMSRAVRVLTTTRRPAQKPAQRRERG